MGVEVQVLSSASSTKVGRRRSGAKRVPGIRRSVPRGSRMPAAAAAAAELSPGPPPRRVSCKPPATMRHSETPSHDHRGVGGVCDRAVGGRVRAYTRADDRGRRDAEGAPARGVRTLAPVRAARELPPAARVGSRPSSPRGSSRRSRRRGSAGATGSSRTASPSSCRAPRSAQLARVPGVARGLAERALPRARDASSARSRSAPTSSGARTSRPPATG